MINLSVSPEEARMIRHLLVLATPSGGGSPLNNLTMSVAAQMDEQNVSKDLDFDLMKKLVGSVVKEAVGEDGDLPDLEMADYSAHPYDLKVTA